MEHWAIETESLIFLRRLGWTKDMMKPGDTISATRGARKERLTHDALQGLELADGRQFACFPNSS